VEHASGWAACDAHVVIAGGQAGLAAAYWLKRYGPSFVVLEALESFGGTWQTHKYPGIRSDSDLHTFGYRFKPWTGTPIATADEIARLSPTKRCEHLVGGEFSDRQRRPERAANRFRSRNFESCF